MQIQSDTRAKAQFRFADMFCSVALAMLCGASVAMFTGSFWDLKPVADFAGVLFLCLTAFYRGSARTFWILLAPAAMILLFAPIARWESIGDFETHGDLFRTALIPGLSFIGAALLLTVRQTVMASLEGQNDLRDIAAQSARQVKQLRKLEDDIRDLVRPTSVWAPPTPKLPNWERVEFRLDEKDLQAPIEAQVTSFREIQTIIEQEMDRLADALATREGLIKPQIGLKFSAPAELSVPLAVRADRTRLLVVVRALLVNALESLGGQDGTLRLKLRPELETVSFEIEDNGRGLSEPMMARLEERGLAQVERDLAGLDAGWLGSRLSFSRLRQVSEEGGWVLDRAARMGVGARSLLLLPRVDILQSSPRVERVREILRAATVVDPLAEPRCSSAVSESSAERNY